ncbi:hypothetical protein LR48_Vigan02g270000 [Vigna angularis]|uniref:Uncharacterized protein n=2 Tax=Phaseolus angularis TaxID=3914 RepID=A0A0L9U196_PHAAN|nr:uncharacterized protein LOC108325867 [Vigna angularis]XP_017414461.1 uncharacterized protein LOC108325867 [Vigna angularis]XP_017414462.1 uncharacterized protein LOC108325867 [Vigna angularis]XP_052729988.1 uncharacterized protein LOC108325867 [Vigna angularis]BAT93575.1 hypothetical protein VIGAN_08008800 [Vigna angularis var. angularis]KAG2401016.1 uncharacterized protein HKW66_Vig0199480 [Vigna angularis]KOM36550.1 hypothetical protein LR48_Vigan02g270000 [Vigna angularis]
MPVSGHEETGVKSYAGQFSGLIAGVPIKKRRFPSFQPSSSPVSEEPCSLSEETELQRKENSSTSQGSTLSNASIAGAPIKKRRFPFIQPFSSSLEEASRSEESDALRKEHSSTSPGSTLSTSSSSLSDANGIPALEDKKASTDVANANTGQSNSIFLIPKLEEPNLGTQSCTLDVRDSKETVLLSEDINKKLESQIIKGNPELLLAAKEGLALSIGTEVSKQNVKDICRKESPLVSGSTSLSLSLEEHLFPAVESVENDKSRLKIEKSESVSLELSLSKEDCSSHSLNTDAKTDRNKTPVHSNRANWDLNTTMDAWEESGTEAGLVKTCVDGLKITENLVVEKQLMCSTGMTRPTSVLSVKPVCEESQKKDFTFPSAMCGQQCKFGDSSNLSLTPFLQKYTEEPAKLSVKLNSGSSIPNVSLPSVALAAGDANTSSFRLVKPEPFDGNLKKELKEANTSTPGSLDSVTVKQELFPPIVVKCSKLSNVSSLMKADAVSVKQEVDHTGNQENSNAAVNKRDRLDKELQQGLDDSSPSLAMSIVPDTKISAEAACPQAKPGCTAQLSASENTVSQIENISSTNGDNVGKVCHGTCLNSEQDTIEAVTVPVVDNGSELKNSGLKISSASTEEKNAANRDACRLKLMNEPLAATRGSAEGCASDEEKITLSGDMLEDVSYGSDYESDENHAVTIPVDTERYVEDDDYEDGEVREPLDPSIAEDNICEVREVEHPDCSNFVNKQMEKGMVSGDCAAQYQVVENDNKTVIQSEINCEDAMDIEMHERSGKVVDKNVCLQESLEDEKSSIAAHGNKPVNVLQKKALDLVEGKNVSEALVTESLSNQATDGSNGVDVQCADEVVKTTDTVKQTDLELPNMELSANANDASKDVNNGGNPGRIIDLSRATSSSSPGKTRSISGRSQLSSRPARDVLSDALDGDKLQRGRDDVYIDGPHKFSRERHQDMSPRNSRLNFGRGRGRLNSRLDSVRSEWESDREFSGEFYNGPNQFRGPRPKYASAFANTDLEYNNVAPDGSYVGNGRLGRKPMSDGSYIAPRRRSPGGRDGIQIGHRNPRNISPNRCIGDGSDLVGVRHNDKFLRGLPEDNLDAMFTRPQTFEGMDGRFTRGSRNFSSMPRRGLPRMRSKSPIRSRSRSPGPWSSPRRRSPRRRSPDSFGGHPELNHRRSPFYRVDRMRSPDRPVFPAERVVRRHGSPSFMSRPSNDMRDIDSARDHGHPRSGRILIRNRRFDVVDPRDRTDNDDDYFGGPMHSGRLLELSGEGNGEDRRRFGERRGPVRTFRPPYNNNVGENFHLNAEEGPRHYRFCSDDSDFHERGGNNIRERDFDRRMKGRPGNVPPPRRTRNMDEQEENFRHGGGGGGGGGGGQVWSDDSFDDISRVKRKRF